MFRILPRTVVVLLFLALGGVPLAAQLPADLKLDVPEIKLDLPGVPGLASGPVISLVDDSQKKVIECQGEAVSIMGNLNEVVIKGSCTGVTIMGNENAVTVESVPTVSVTGTQNRVVVTTVGTISVTGHQNQLTWSKGLVNDPEITNLGDGNTIIQTK